MFSDRINWRELASPQQPWIYLVYLVAVALPWYDSPPSGAALLQAVLYIGVFLFLFVIAMSRRDWAALPAAALTVALGLSWLPENFGAAVLLIFAAAMVARIRDARLARWGLLGWTGIVLVGALGIGVHWMIVSGYLMFGGIIASATAWSASRTDRDALQDEREADAASRAADAERQRIARDLHDLLGHTLSVITLKADLAGRLFEADPERSRSELAEIERISRNALAEVREAVTGLRGRPLGEVAREIAGRLRRAGLDVQLDWPDTPPELSAEIEAGLGMMLREGATNILRHAEADSVRIRLELGAATSRLSLLDDGQGGAQFSGGGLTGLRDRLHPAGVNLTLQPGIDGQGTGLEAKWGAGETT